MLQKQYMYLNKNITAILFVLIFSSQSSFSQLPNNLIFDSKQTQVFGSENLLTTHKLIYQSLNKVVPNKLKDESTFLDKSIGASYRLGKLLLLDFQIDFMFALTQHEVFGHGSRMREFGYTNISYELKPFFPFGEGRGLASGNYPFEFSNTISQRLAVMFSGNEGNLVFSNNFEERFLLKGNIPYRQALLFLITRNNTLQYSSRTYLFDGRGDIRNYVKLLNSGSRVRYSERKLFLQSLIVLLNPMQFYSMWTIGKEYLFDGKSKLSKIPMINLGNIKYLPSLNFNLTPFGSEFILNNFILKEKRLIKVQLKIGDPTFYNFYSMGFKLYNLVDNDLIKLHLKVEGWFQPRFELGGKMIEEISKGPGILGDVSFSITPFNAHRNMGLFGSIGYKTNGYAIGEPLDNGGIIRLGITFKN